MMEADKAQTGQVSAGSRHEDDGWSLRRVRVCWAPCRGLCLLAPVFLTGAYKSTVLNAANRGLGVCLGDSPKVAAEEWQS